MTTQQIQERFISSTIKSFELNVTPEIATHLLAASPGNRKIRMDHVRMMAADIKRGEWKVTHQSIAIDWNGFVRDGHHRLMAIVMAATTVRMLVTIGLNPNSFDVVDQGVPRTVADITGLDNRIAMPLRLGAIIARGTARPSMPQVQEIGNAGLIDVLEEIIEHCGTSRRYVSSAPIRLAAAVSILGGADREFVLGQYRALVLLDFDASSIR